MGEKRKTNKHMKRAGKAQERNITGEENTPFHTRTHTHTPTPEQPQEQLLKPNWYDPAAAKRGWICRIPSGTQQAKVSRARKKPAQTHGDRATIDVLSGGAGAGSVEAAPMPASASADVGFAAASGGSSRTRPGTEQLKPSRGKSRRTQPRQPNEHQAPGGRGRIGIT